MDNTIWFKAYEENPSVKGLVIIFTANPFGGGGGNFAYWDGKYFRDTIKEDKEARILSYVTHWTYPSRIPQPY